MFKVGVYLEKRSFKMFEARLVICVNKNVNDFVITIVHLYCIRVLEAIFHWLYSKGLLKTFRYCTFIGSRLLSLVYFPFKQILQKFRQNSNLMVSNYNELRWSYPTLIDYFLKGFGKLGVMLTNTLLTLCCSSLTLVKVSFARITFLILKKYCKTAIPTQ